jgi:hypothetical protein
MELPEFRRLNSMILQNGIESEMDLVPRWNAPTVPS